MTIEEYKTHIARLAELNSDAIFYNDSPEHAAHVISQILLHSKKEVRVVDNIVGDITDDYDILLNTIDYFFNKKHAKMMYAFSECKEQSALMRKFRSIQNNPELKHLLDLRKTDKAFNDAIEEQFKQNIIFTLGDEKMFRIQEIITPTSTSNQSHSRNAYCSFNRPNTVNELKKFFDINFKKLEPTQ